LGVLWQNLSTLPYQLLRATNQRGQDKSRQTRENYNGRSIARATDAGKMAHYVLRWRMRDGSVGAWGDTVSATITG